MRMRIMRNRTSKILAASAVAIMLAPAALSAMPQQTVSANAVGTVSTTTPVYDSTGKANGVTLPGGSQWQLGQQITLNGVAHYQVGNNEYIPASVVTNVTGQSNSEDDTNTVGRYVSDNPDAGKTAVANTTLHIVDAYGNDTGATLPAGSAWKIGSILHANKMTYYQVGTNQFISTSDVTVENPTTTISDPYISTDANYGKTVTVKSAANVVNDNATATGVVLPVGSQWRIADFLFVNGKTYYKVATNEWISEDDITITGPATGSNGSYITNDSSNAGQTATTTATLKVLNGSGVPTGATLPSGTRWVLGPEVLHYDKQLFYQVATNEFVSAMYLNSDAGTSTSTSTTTTNTNTSANANSSLPTPGNGLTATMTKNQKVYNTSTNAYGQVLPAGSTWKIGSLVVNKYGSYWGQVSSNEWVWISAVQLNSGLNLKNNSYYEPDFATNVVDQ